MNLNMIEPEEIDRFYKTLKDIASFSGYYLNPDRGFVNGLLEGLLINQKRYGYPACPCRLASGVREEDLDIICPCDYRDMDIDEYGTCYCSLYVSKDVYEGRINTGSIPERRPPSGEKDIDRPHSTMISHGLPLPVWRCRVCGYLCARKDPPLVCPICKADKDKFVRFV